MKWCIEEDISARILGPVEDEVKGSSTGNDDGERSEEDSALMGGGEKACVR